ncbi:GGDEF and EAL domain-containing protein [uncultured Roseobacter sp.]|uniref:putative bifunctional diguanylate cyclase/phosphodiesterase n=1 Tax=uncultured Roseobacter sp. TaxID=114847 RepID=UPI002606442E|nr:GGDEF and EAL domain-containing protein [uncultured Roseobacter sp.]
MSASRPSPKEWAAEIEAFKTSRKMTRAMMRLTVTVTLLLSLVAGGFQLFLDLFQEMESVKNSAGSLVESMVPGAENAVWDFDKGAAARVVDGLFLQRAVTRVSIYDNDDLFYTQSRTAEQTFPILGHYLTSSETVVTRPLMEPTKSGLSDSNPVLLGRIEIVVDRTIVSPNVVQRLVTYFVVAFLKNVLLCACLVMLAFSGLARHAVSLATSLSSWRPTDGAVSLEAPPKYLRNTEIETLGRNIQKLTEIASREFATLRTSNDKFADLNAALATKSENLSQTLQRKNFELKVKNQELLKLATRDGLTGAFNRRHFDQLAKEIWEDPETDLELVSIILADIDYFKKYNDHFGHGAGDICLRDVAKLLEARATARGATFARYGGEEFIILMRSGSIADDLAGDIVQSVADLELGHPKSRVAKHVTISVGVAQNSVVRAKDLDDLIAAADSALYEAKRLGRNRIHTAPSDFLVATERENTLETALLTAIRNYEFEPFYQPQFDGRDGRIVGVEVLARWRKEDGSLGNPVEIFGMAKKLGIVDHVDAIIQDAAIADLSSWFKKGIAPEKFAINVSEEALLSGQIRRLYDGQPKRIQDVLAFELLETIGFENKSTVFNMRLDELMELGVPIEIDDFGTGATSINTLSFLAPKRLKVARELVTMIGESDRGETVIKAVVEIAHSFGIDLIAEGVELEEQSRTLMDLGIPIQQGFLFARPMPATELEEMLRDEASHPRSA